MAAVAYEIENYVDEVPAEIEEIEPDNLDFVLGRLQNLHDFRIVRREAGRVYLENAPHTTPGRIVKVVFYRHV
ncbi:hypothetical protein ARTSIC4J27_255 [Pseudarthrobacter siccitolerans]|uniref:Uncharacterized protein n=1 Tax=Pseudarthrobacter siccitolerans TaxID=861266 RepID=A0A024GXX5_9MICC|nr:hypothetical protein [Pseudarthrobacter siccitolerans]CCQ44331.1 hypothetical protein ARTSIC4J27_255 [Pseudarthrobacter siccitolerans]